MKVKTAQITGQKKIEINEVEIEPKADELIVKHLHIAPSIGTFMHLYKGEHKEVSRGWNPDYPIMIGGNGVGVVEEIGREVKGFQKGDYVTVGGVSDYSSMNQNQTVKLPEGIHLQSATMIFQAEIALQSVRRAEIYLGDKVLVMGQGAIGNFVAQFCKLGGAHKVLTSDVSEKALEVSSRNVADCAINVVQENLAEKVKEFTNGNGADIVFDVTGVPRAFVDGAKAVRHFGKYVIVGWFVEPFQINLADDFSPKGLDIINCHGDDYLGNWKQYRKTRSENPVEELRKETASYIFDLIDSGELQCKDMISHQFDFADTAKVFETVDTNQGEILAAVINF